MSRAILILSFVFIFSHSSMVQAAPNSCEITCENEYTQTINNVREGCFARGGTNCDGLEEDYHRATMRSCISQCTNTRAAVEEEPKTCAGGTTTTYPYDFGDAQCKCPEGSRLSFINPGDEASVCGYIGENPGEDCDLLKDRGKHTPESLACQRGENQAENIEGCRKSIQGLISGCGSGSLSTTIRANQSFQYEDNQKNTGAANVCISQKSNASNMISDAELHVNLCKIHYTNLDGCPANASQLFQAQEVFLNLEVEAQKFISEMRKVEKQATDCVNAFIQDETKSLGSLLNDVANGYLNSKENSKSASDELERSSPRPALTPGFQGTGDNSFRENTYSRLDDETGFNSEGDPDNSTHLNNENNSTRSPTQSSNDSSPPPSGFRGGFVGGHNNSGSPQAKAQKKGRGRRNFSNSKDRNLVLGYRKVKKGKSTFTYHPSDLKKYGKTRGIGNINTLFSLIPPGKERY